MERRKAMRFRKHIASQAVPEAKQDKARLAALHAPRFRGKARAHLAQLKRGSDDAWLFENRIWNDEVMHTSATPTIVITGLVPVIHVLPVYLKKRRGWPGHRRAEATPFFERLCPAMTNCGWAG
ncbi:hypothetical protein [Afipia massiliensis]|nr:hypothetical protein [Afipia massiliensis]